MTILKTTYPIPPTSAVVTHDGQQFTTGKGIKVLYAADEASGAGFLLTENANVYGSIGAIMNRDDVEIDQDFDIKLEAPLIVEGLMDVNMPYALDTVTSNNAWDRGIGVILRKVSGGTETDIVSGSHLIKEFQNAGTTEEFIFTKQLVVPRTIFAKGDTIRLTINAPSTATAGPEERRLAIGIDPRGRATVTVGDFSGDTTPFATTSQTAIYLPFKIDL